MKKLLNRPQIEVLTSRYIALHNLIMEEKLVKLLTKLKKQGKLSKKEYTK